MKSILHATLGRLVFVPIWLAAFAPVHAGDNPVVDALKITPVSIFTYGLANLHGHFRATFAGEKAAPYTWFAAPLSGRMADITSVIYSDKTDTVTLNVVKIEKLEGGATPRDACAQVMRALRTYAGLDPATGQLQGVDASLLSTFFLDGSLAADAGAKPGEIDRLFRLRFNGSTDTGRFTCTADLFGTDYTLAK